MTEYEKHLQKLERDKKERYIREFEKFPKGGIFRKLKIDITPDYEFVEDDGEIEKVYYSNSNRNYINSTSLYFRKINNNLCVELITRKIFNRMPDGVFYNEETGLKFDFNSSFEEAIGLEIDWVYVDNTKNFFEHYEELQSIDKDKIDKYRCLLLKRGIKFRR